MEILGHIIGILIVIFTIVLMIALWQSVMEDDGEITIIREIRFILPEDDKDDEDKSKEKNENKSQSKR